MFLRNKHDRRLDRSSPVIATCLVSPSVTLEAKTLHRRRKVDSIDRLEQDLYTRRMLIIGIASKQKLRVTHRIEPDLKPPGALVGIDRLTRHPSRLPDQEHRVTYRSAAMGCVSYPLLVLVAILVEVELGAEAVGQIENALVEMKSE